jgi:hypothetical protein
MAFKKGQSGNPGGKRKNPGGVEKPFKTALQMELLTKGKTMPELRKIARMMIDEALSKGAQAQRNVIIERLDGKLPLPLAGPDGEGAVTVILKRPPPREKS